MQAKLIESAAHATSQQRLAAAYRDGTIPAEKKPFLIDLARSAGPYLSVQDSDEVILDGASQIATLGLGFNHGALFGAAQSLSSWIDDTRSADFRDLRTAYANLLVRKLGSANHTVAFCHSGAEAIERALAVCFENRREPSADRVLAFEGAFHGRTKFALEATWSPEKRVPFSWSDQSAVFAPYPESDSDDPTSAAVPRDWIAAWSGLSAEELAKHIQRWPTASDSLLRLEIESLSVVRQALASKACFAILIEPMQSEGGERYSTARFHLGLAALARAYGVPIVYDEIQTGFHLGRTFFWFQQFELSRRGVDYFPDVVVTAKKAQVGVVLSRFPLSAPDPCPASLARGYIQASMLDQFAAEVANIESQIAKRLTTLADRHAAIVRRPRGQGLAFAFDLPDAATMQRAVAARFPHGLVFYPAGERTVRFRLSLAFHEQAIDQLFVQLDQLLGSLAGEGAARQAAVFEIASPAPHFAFHERLIREKLATLEQRIPIAEVDVVRILDTQIRELGLRDSRLSVRLLNRESYPKYRDKILQVQVDVYEPARQTPGEDFDRVFASDRPLAIVVEKSGAIIGMAFAGPLNQFQFVHGVASDPFHDRADAAYMVDATVAASYRGGLGRILKQAIVLLAIAKGYRTIHGRNRDQLARGMWAINLSLGSFVTQHLENDYDDAEKHRDCLYYRCPVVWEPPKLYLSRGIEAPFGISDLTPEFVSRNLAKVVNKLTLSNFVDGDFLADLSSVMELFPAALRHGFTASSLSEGVDKVVKSLWEFRKTRKRLLTFRGHWFGDGTFLSRALSGVGTPRYEVRSLDPPRKSDDEDAFGDLKTGLGDPNTLALFVEPLSCQAMARVEPEVLARIRSLCTEANVPLVYNESAGLFFRYDSAGFAPSQLPGIEPDAIVATLGGQMALALLRESLFAREPLKIISTWDGDGFSLAKFAAAARNVMQDTATFKQLAEQFLAALQSSLVKGRIRASELRGGCGWIEGELPLELAVLLERNSTGRWLLAPSPSAMRQFIQEFGE